MAFFCLGGTSATLLHCLDCLVLVALAIGKHAVLRFACFGIPYFYHLRSLQNTRNLGVLGNSPSPFLVAKAHLGSWKAIKNLAVVASSLLTAVLFKITDGHSYDLFKLAFLYPSFVFSLMALLTASMFIGFFDGAARGGTSGADWNPTVTQSVIFSIPAITFVWGILLALVWMACITIQSDPSVLYSADNASVESVLHQASVSLFISSLTLSVVMLVSVVYMLRHYGR